MLDDLCHNNQFVWLYGYPLVRLLRVVQVEFKVPLACPGREPVVDEADCVDEDVRPLTHELCLVGGADVQYSYRLTGMCLTRLLDDVAGLGQQANIAFRLETKVRLAPAVQAPSLEVALNAILAPGPERLRAQWPHLAALNSCTSSRVSSMYVRPYSTESAMSLASWNSFQVSIAINGLPDSIADRKFRW